MKTETRTQLLAAAAMLIFLGASGVMAVQLTASGGRHRLSYADVAVDGQPPQVAAGIAMGAFRGLFVNMLWIRANTLKEEGRYYEAMDLAKAITALQPRFPRVWVFHAWNMAYNISVTTQTPQERWSWVQAGIDLLRREGIPHNPNDLLLHRELGWFFLHKIGGYMDDANLYYKRQLAAEWTLVLGPPPPSDTGTGTTDFAAITQRYADWLRPIANAPDSLSDVIRANPRVGELVDRLRRELNWDVTPDLARRYVEYLAIKRSGEAVVVVRGMGSRSQKLYEMMDDSAWRTEWEALLAHLRRRMLLDEYNMDPQRMVRYTETYGPVDWRHHAAHGLYWSTRGVENAMLRFTEENKLDFDFVNANRVVVQSLQDLWRSGDMYFDFWAWMKDRTHGRPFYRGSPNIHFIESYGDHMMEFVERTVDPRVEGRGRAYSMYAAGYENFRKDAIRFLYRRGERARAAQMKEDLAKWPHANLNDPGRAAYFAEDIDVFVRAELEDQLTRPSVVREEVIGSLHGAYIQGLLAGNIDLFHSQMEYAALVHRFFFTHQNYRNHLDPNTLRMAQIDPDFRVIAGKEFAILLLMLEFEHAERLYDAAPRDLRRWGYDIIVNRFREGMIAMEEAGGRRFEDVFPEPEGMEQHRERMRRLEERERQNIPALQHK
jgi:hypothetical protein